MNLTIYKNSLFNLNQIRGYFLYNGLVIKFKTILKIVCLIKRSTLGALRKGPDKEVRLLTAICVINYLFITNNQNIL